MQFDLFNDSQGVALRNDVIHAVLQGDAVAARLAWDTLRHTCPQDDSLVPMDVLVTALAERTSVPLSSHEALSGQRHALHQTLAPAAQRTMGAVDAAAWLRVRWQELAQRAARLPYQPERPEDHAAPLWLCAAEWQAAADAVAGIASWRRIPSPLAWMLQARLNLLGLQASWPLLAELAWLAPERLDAVATAVADPMLQALRLKFEQDFEVEGDPSDLAWFPAWVLIEKPALAPALTQAQASQHRSPEQAMRLLLVLLGLERQGRQSEVIEHRKALRGLSGALYGLYMSRR
jgi:hypothetical protein